MSFSCEIKSLDIDAVKRFMSIPIDEVYKAYGGW
jgi:hypothetical protein